MKILTNLDLAGNQILNGVFQVLASDPQTNKQGAFYFNSTNKKFRLYNGTAWVDAGVVNFSDLQNLPTSISGYGIVDAKITTVSGKKRITLGAEYVDIEGNVIEIIKVNGTQITPTNKAVDISVPVAATATPEMDGTAAIGTSSKFAKEDHVHPSDTSRAAASDLSALDSRVEDIEDKIPSQASEENELADKDFVNSSIQNVAAFYITKNAAGDPFATKAELLAATVVYSGGAVRVPTRNDYCVVLADESKTITETGENPTTRYIYSTSGDYSANNWNFQYVVNRSGLTAAQWAAANSGITNSKRVGYDNHLDSTNNPHNVTKTQVGLGNVDNTSDSTKKSNFTGNIADGNTGFTTGDQVYGALSGKQDKSNLVTEIDESSDDTHYPSAKAVYEALGSASSGVGVVTGTIGTSATRATVSYSGTFLNCFVKDSITNEEIITDVTINANTVVVDVASAPERALTVYVVYRTN